MLHRDANWWDACCSAVCAAVPFELCMDGSKCEGAHCLAQARHL
jgi:hypothetical protein